MRLTKDKYVYLPCLREKMKLAGATWESLASASGLSTMPIRHALQGRTIYRRNALYLYEALNTRKFNRCPQGGRL